ncbi:type I-C CRISPR-associated protein Cas8c/Csd1 [Desulforamulus aquiferis]|uniref:Type I-C CRISPR-associated protein Cas8c/Csd1 n=1 Tax=Desulforamulus aquiferis TaxID=1397668 RepID=A0AAW7ZHH7_9FIRM|nr:type I-C CRISPR-associated protein Cas8c/Csd1 [Desulforamulus aquiferis]MDO7788728.1 type I-C CRISPR-associated protein Cas8c/Csd1 [Desulforamulus aquiferis]
MIINALYNYYDTLQLDPNSGISQPGYSKAKVSYCLLLSMAGQLLEVIDLRVDGRNKLVPREIEVPEQAKRTSGVAANFMCDNSTYVLGLGENSKKEKQQRIKECFQDFLQLHENILKDVTDEPAKALLHFLRGWNVDSALNHPAINTHLEGLTEGSNLVFKVEGFKGYIHEREAVRDAWSSHKKSNESEVIMQCLVTGKKARISRLHPSIKGVTGAQSSGASLISFNLDSFTSYGKSQSFNAPVAEDVTFKYTTALNYLLNSPKHRIRIADATVVFWAEQSTNGLEEDILSMLFFPPSESSPDEDKKLQKDSEVIRDPQTVRLLHDIFIKIKNGQPISGGLTGINENTKFYILGLSPNASRLAVRFWHVDNFGVFLERIGQHYKDLAIEKRFDKEPDYISTWMLLKETAPLKDVKRIAPLLGGVLMRSMLTGSPYPKSLFNSIISRIRADQEVNYIRASVIKACLAREQRYYNKGSGVDFSMSLNKENRNIGYMLGRLFSLLEKAQEDANPGINATIRDRYFGSASASPGSVFPILLRLAQHHIAKAEYGKFTDKRIEEVISYIDSFPAHLNLEEQGQFVLGYYQQRQDLFKKIEKKEC